MVVDSNFNFLQSFYCRYSEKEKNLKMLTCGNTKLFFVLRGNLQFFIDGSFRIAPKPCFQLLAAMVFSKQAGVCAPVICVLVPGKEENDYYSALHWEICASKKKLEATAAACDFENEKRLANQIKAQFPSVKGEHGNHVPGEIASDCLLHFKQAARRKSAKIKLSKKLGKEGIKIGPVDLHTTAPKGEIRVTGVLF